MTSTTHKETRV